MRKKSNSYIFSHKILKSRYIDISQLDKSNRAEILQRDYQVKKELLLQENKMIQNLEQKLGIILGGYGKKLNQIQRSIEDVLQDLGQANFDPEFFKQHENDLIEIYNSKNSSHRVRLKRKRGLFKFAN